MERHQGRSSSRRPVLPLRLDRQGLARRRRAAPNRRTSAAPDEPSHAQRAPIHLARLLATSRPHLGAGSAAAAAVQQHGPDALPPLYEAMARRIFGGADHYGVISEDLSR